MAIEGFPALVVSPSVRATEFLSKINLSFIPNLHSGIPLKYMIQISEFIMRIKPRIFEVAHNESAIGTYLK